MSGQWDITLVTIIEDSVSTEPDAGFDLPNREIMTWAEIKSQTLNQLSQPGTPVSMILKPREYMWCTFILDLKAGMALSQGRSSTMIKVTWKSSEQANH